MSSYPQKLVIFCPRHLKNKYGEAIADLFNVDGNLELIVQMENYTRLEEGSGSEYADYFNGTGVNLSLMRVGFIVNVTDQRFELRLAIEEIRSLSLSTNYGIYVPLRVRDYCRVEYSDYVQGWTERVGKIGSVEDGAKGGGTNKSGVRHCNSAEVPDVNSRLYGGGFKFRFLERQLRLIS